MTRALESLIAQYSKEPHDHGHLGNFRVDKSALDKFPKGTQIISANQYGTSAWAATARLHFKLPDGSNQQFFFKAAPGDHGRTLAEGEYHSLSELYKCAPDLIPKPHSWGRCAATFEHDDTTDGAGAAYFVLTQFIDFIDATPNPNDPEVDVRMPDPEQLCAKVARLHRDSRSPTGQFGFHVTTCQGRIPQALSWEKNWVVFFTRMLQHACAIDCEFNGYWGGLDRLEKQLVSQVVPRLLGALYRDGRSVKPSLIHADLWEGNTGTAERGNDVYVFDAAAFYAHSEMDIAYWRSCHNRISDRVYMRTYFRMCEPSEPKSEWDDRSRLYSVYYNLIYSANHLRLGEAGREL